MKSIFESVIARGNYDLTSILNQIDMYHVEGKLTDDDRVELYAKARDGAAPRYDYSTEIEAIWAAIRALQASQTTPSEPDEPGTEVEWPEYVQPTGAHDAYNTGDKITFNGEHYTCKQDNCVWSPSAYPAAWEKESV